MAGRRDEHGIRNIDIAYPAFQHSSGLTGLEIREDFLHRFIGGAVAVEKAAIDSGVDVIRFRT